MKQFTGLEYLKIDIANKFGLDKELWEDRIKWTDTCLGILEELAQEAAEPYLYTKAVLALRDTQNNVPTGHVMGLDSTASGLQIMACLIGCKTTAANVNLLDTGARDDIYEKMATTMTSLIGKPITRSEIKHPTMTK